jgi:hypothetical protein
MNPPASVAIVVDVANVMGTRPDGWWRDRAAAATRLVQALATLSGRSIPDPRHAEDDASPAPSLPDLQVSRVLAVVEGQARQIPQVSSVDMVRASGDGDSAVVQACRSVLDGGGVPLAVTADRGLRAALPTGTVVAGPRWLLAVLDGQSRKSGSAGGISTSI